MSDEPPVATTTAAAANRVQTWTGNGQEEVRKRELLAAFGSTWGKFGEWEPFGPGIGDGLAVHPSENHALAREIAQHDIAAFMRAIVPAPTSEVGSEEPLVQHRSVEK